MNWADWLLWGFLATLVQSVIAASAQGLGLTRMNIPYMLGTIFTANRDRAKLYGFMSHMAMGWMFSLIYVVIFDSIGHSGWWRGALIGIVHGTFLLTVVVSLLPGLHPRMASEQQGPTAGNMLEPPGFLAMNYGLRTPISVLLGHALFGILLGAFYRVK
jgi:hypothetical protein